MKSLSLYLSLLSLTTSLVTGAGDTYILGLGIGDITGPVVETNMMGYASLDQNDTGLHMRQRSRAFLVSSSTSSSALSKANTIVFINADIAMGDTGVRRSIVNKLGSLYPNVLDKNNIAFVGTHSHAGVGGYLENLLPQVTSLGYVPLAASAIVDGTVRAVQRAIASAAPGTLSTGNTTILDANINRSPIAYQANPAAERAQYQYDQDKDMSVLKFSGSDGKARGFLSFFAVHGTSLFNNNTLVSGDNKGLAAYLYEDFAEPGHIPGNSSFVAGFVQANVGDTSPNTLGAVCFSPGMAWDQQPCHPLYSTCGNGTTADCHGRGPGYTVPSLLPLSDGTFKPQWLGYESNRIIATRQFEGAKRVMSASGQSVAGPVRSVHVNLKIANYSFQLPNGTTVKTCPAAMGYAFAGGTSDGPGALDFVQGDNGTSHNAFWDIVKGAVTPPPSAEQVACQAPKPILLNTGYATWPYNWAADTVDIQMLRVGNFVMLIVPGELTTMAGRRLRNAVRSALISQGVIGNDAYVVVAGPANTYGHYVTTKEEYAVQRYEGGSTIYGQYTLDAYINKYSSLVPYLAANATGSPPTDPAPADQTPNAISLQTGVVLDNTEIGKSFGQLLINVKNTTYHAGDMVVAKFVGANPRNNLRLDGTFLAVDQLVSDNWKTVRTDSHPSTVYRWERTNLILGYSTVNISWTIEPNTPAGTYRFRYFGDYKNGWTGSINAFTGTSSNFNVG